MLYKSRRMYSILYWSRSFVSRATDIHTLMWQRLLQILRIMLFFLTMHIAYNILYVWVGVLSTFRCVFNYCSIDTILSLATFNTRHILNFQYPIWYCLRHVFRLLLWFLFAIRLVKVFFNSNFNNIFFLSFV